MNLKQTTVRQSACLQAEVRYSLSTRAVASTQLFPPVLVPSPTGVAWNGIIFGKKKFASIPCVFEFHAVPSQSLPCELHRPLLNDKTKEQDKPGGNT